MIGPDGVYEPAGKRLVLADDAFLLMLDVGSGRLRAGSRPGGLFLAAALIGELVLSGHLTAVDDRLSAPAPGPAAWPGCPVLRLFLAEVEREAKLDPELTVADWLSYLAPAAEGMVAERLQTAGILRVVRARGLRGRSTRYETEPDGFGVAAYAPLRLGEPIAARAKLGPQDTMLVALLAATGLSPLILAAGHLHDVVHAPGQFDALAASVCAWPALDELARATGHLVGAAALASH